MSGPITAGYFIVHGAILFAARALAEARAMKREYADVLSQMRDRERQIAEGRRGQRAARLERMAALRHDADRQVARYERLSSLAQGMSAEAPDLARRMPAALPAAPAGDDDAAWTAHLGRIKAAVRELELLLGEAGGAFAAQVRATLAATTAAPSVDDVLAAFVLQRQMKPGLDPAETERFRQTAARVLSRLDSVDGAAMAPELEALAKAIVLSPSLERAEALASELRLAVQRHRDAKAAQKSETAEAKRLLDALPDDAPAPLLRALEQVAAGVARMDATLADAVQRLQDEVAGDIERREQDAAAFVLQESLRDLGYEVEDIGATLFVDGGAVHFRREGWENYFVRLRANPLEHTVNFNVVRARGDEETAERRRQDALAEDRWCAEFPKLLQTLAARGLRLDVTRRLDAGAVPVQVVDAAGLPRIAADEGDSPPRAKPRARENP
ncbi:MAG: hypothetical protein ABI569_02270 [Casimicrobiaceae bacterium]